MAILTIKVDDNVLEEAKRIFDEIGMDIDRAINENWTKMLEKNVKKEDTRKVEKNKTNLDEDIEELVYEGLDV